MAEEKQTLPSGLEAEKELGPSVTYHNLDGSAKYTSVGGLALEDGKSVNFVEKLGPARAKPLLQKLAGNHFFTVDGGPDHKELRERNTDLVAEATRATALREREAAERRYADAMRAHRASAPAVLSAEPPEGYEAPEQARLAAEEMPAAKAPPKPATQGEAPTTPPAETRPALPREK